jgi:hypothetical protein
VVGAVDDVFEREAERVADRVVGLTAGVGVGLGVVGEPPGLQRQAEEAAVEEPVVNPLVEQIEMLLAEEGVRAKSAGPGPSPTPEFASALVGSKGGGAPLPGPVKAEMESAFGVDFGGVRVHTDSRAVEMSRGINAYAFTYGQDIYFNQGAFEPASREGTHLLAHELTHTLQQSDGHIRRLTITRNSRTKLTCGGFDVKWTFALDNPAPAHGYIVQKVRQYETMESCPSDVKGMSATPKLQFWEAWDVSKGDTVDWTTTRDGWTDGSTRPSEPDKSGLRAAVGTVKFFPRSTTGDLGGFGTPSSDPGSDWGPGKVPASGGLPSTASEPSWWKDPPTEGPAQRWASSWWNCCAAGPARNEIDSSP